MDPSFVVPVSSDDPRLSRLLQLYLHEWSAKLPARVRIGPDALYAYPDLARWSEEGHEALLFFEDESPTGFALTSVDADGVWHVEELFVVAGARRGGVGRRAFDALAARRPGAWSFTVRPENGDGLAFWRTVTGTNGVEEPGTDGVTRFRFVVRR